MKKRKRWDTKKHMKMLQWVVPIILLVLFIFITVMDYSVEYRRKTEKSIAETLESKAYELGIRFYTELDVLKQTAMPMAYVWDRYERAFTDGELIAMLSGLEESTNAYRALIVSTDGRILLRQTDYMLKDSDITVPRRDTIKNHFSKAFVDKATGKRTIVVSIPIGTERFLYLYYPMDRFENMTDFSHTSTYAVIEEDGTLIGVSGDENSFAREGLNIYEVMREAEFESGSLRSLIVSSNVGKNGHLVCIYQGEKRYISYSPLNEGQWILLEITKMELVKNMAASEWRSLKNILLKMGISLCVFFVMVGCMNIFSRVKFSKESKELQDKAERDLLTGLLNKISTENHIREYLGNAGPDQRAMMFVLDIDNFKKINDTMGHAFGDEVLSTLGHRIRALFRASDIIGRTGGDEFILFLKDIKDEQTVKKEADKVANFFQSFKVGEYTKYSATASIGVVVFPQDGRDFEALYKAADLALYKAKKRGKNQLAFYRETEEEKEKPAGQGV